jgi:arginyl-tRNA synthetase
MTQFEENNPQQLKEFIKQFRMLMDEFHPNTYTIDGVWEGSRKIEQSIQEVVDKQNTDVLKEIYDKVMMEKTGMTGEEYEEYQQIQFHNERKVDATINRITNTLERINIKLDKLTDTMVNVKK